MQVDRWTNAGTGAGAGKAHLKMHELHFKLPGCISYICMFNVYFLDAYFI